MAVTKIPGAQQKIEELTEEKKLELFSIIMDNSNNTLLQDKTIELLKQIPSYPLDISIAAYYIKKYNVAFDEYLKLFPIIEELNTDNYKTRSQIITLSIKKILEESNNFTQLILFLSLLDSQQIPKKLLSFIDNDDDRKKLWDSYNDNIFVDKFIYELSRFSLITKNSSQDGEIKISIHRSIQKILLNYLMNEKIITDELLILLANHLRLYMCKELDKYYDISKMKALIVHAEMFLNQNIDIPSLAKAYIAVELGNYYYHMYDYEKSKHFLQQGLEIFTKKLGNQDLLLGKTLIQAGGVYISTGNYNKAKELLEQGVAIYKNYYKNDSHEDVAWGIVRLASVNQNLGNYNKSKELLEKAIEIYKQNLSGEHRFAWVFIHLGNIYKNIGDYKKARELLELGVNLHKKIYGIEHFGTMWSSVHLGSVYTNLSEYLKAQEILEHSVEVYMKTYGAEHIETAWAILHLGDLYKNLGDYKRAVDLTEQSLKIFTNHYGKQHIKTAKALWQLGVIEDLKDNNPESAEILINSALKILQQNNHPDSYLCLESLADLYIKKYEQETDIIQKNKYSIKSFEYLTKSLEIVKSNFPINSIQTNKIQSKLNQLKGY